MAPAPGSNILHADLDAFYASVEQVLDPSLQGQPVAVGGGVVLAASYQAKACGVTAGMAGWRARLLCPGLIFVGGHFREYQRLGDAVMAILEDFTPRVERISIDEAFLDVGGSVHLFGPPERMASDIRARVRAETGLAISVGVARTKHLAKIASQVAKPDGLVVVPPEGESDFLRPLPVGLIWGVGPATRARLAGRGITTAPRTGRLGPDDPDEETRRAVDASMDGIRARFGRSAVGYANIELSPVSRVPDEFRELAERGSPPPGSEPGPGEGAHRHG